MSSTGFSADAVLLLSAIRTVRRPAIPANHQYAPAGCPLHRLYTCARRSQLSGAEYERAVRELIAYDAVILSGWATRYGPLRFGRRLTIIFPALIPDWFTFKSDSYVIGLNGESYDLTEKRDKLAQATSPNERRMIETQYEYTLVHDLKLHIVADGLTDGVKSALRHGVGPDGLNHTLRGLARNR